VESYKAASIYKWIIYYNAGYNIVVGEGGIKLLGGERQRITIVRAFFKNSKILLLDKTISAIDNITKKLIRESLKSRGEGWTILTVAYYFSIVKSTNEIIFLKKGEVKERGSYTKLFNWYGLYYKI